MVERQAKEQQRRRVRDASVRRIEWDVFFFLTQCRRRRSECRGSPRTLKRPTKPNWEEWETIARKDGDSSNKPKPIPCIYTSSIDRGGEDRRWGFGRDDPEYGSSGTDDWRRVERKQRGQSERRFADLFLGMSLRIFEPMANHVCRIQRFFTIGNRRGPRRLASRCSVSLGTAMVIAPFGLA